VNFTYSQVADGHAAWPSAGFSGAEAKGSSIVQPFSVQLPELFPPLEYTSEFHVSEI